MLNFIQKLKEKKQDGGTFKWVYGLVAIVLVVVAVAGLSWYINKRGRELAKLKHEKDVRLEEAKQATAAAKALKIKKQKDAKLAEAKKARAEAAKLRKEMKVLDKQNEEAHNIINALKDWDDVEKFIKF